MYNSRETHTLTHAPRYGPVVVTLGQAVLKSPPAKGATPASPASPVASNRSSGIETLQCWVDAQKRTHLIQESFMPKRLDPALDWRNAESGA